jgi:polar amino acid transport system substrate-binding protein
MSKYVCLILLCCLSASAKQLHTSDTKWPPYFFPKLEQSLPGYAKEILNHCITQLGYELSYKSLPIKRTHVYMRSGEIDINLYSYNESRKAFVVYGKEPLFVSKYGFASKASDKIEITQLTDLYKYHIGNLAGLSHTPALRTIIEEQRKQGLVTDGYDLDSMFGQMLATPQRFQIMANSTSTFQWRAKQLGIENEIKVHDFIAAEKPYYLTVSKSTEAIDDIDLFLNNMDSCIVTFKASQKFKALQRKYGLE